MHPLTALQLEYSLWSREPETGLVPALIDLGIVPIQPAGPRVPHRHRQQHHTPERVRHRAVLRRFSQEALAANQPLVDALRQIAADRAVTMAQVALAWLLAQQPSVVPIPGTRSPDRLVENLGAADVHLTADDLSEIAAALKDFEVLGERYPEAQQAMIDR